MGKSIDERVVEMRLNNRNFESNAKNTLSTLSKLQSALAFSGSSKGLNEVGAAVEDVKVRFSALQVIGVTALTNIANSAVNTGKRILSAVTIDPIKSGLQEYETQINAVQTILANTANKGTNIKQVNAALDELNTYADKTIYNFTEMTRNIGTFTAAGVKLDTSVSAIKGIANLAAVSGSTSQQASTAMYQLSQALASGTVKLMDWNSVVNAGMGGQVFQDALKETAKAHGVAIDAIIAKQGSFRESLQTGWLSSEILTETLSKFTGDLTDEQLKSMGYTQKQIVEIQKLGKMANDAATKVKTFTQLIDTTKEALQSGWSQTWRYIIGDFEEAKELWTSVSDTLSNAINKSADARNKIVSEWKNAGGRDALIKIFSNLFHGFESLIKPIKEAFRDIFPSASGKRIAAITKYLSELTSKFKISDETAAKLKDTFKGLFAAFDIVLQIVKQSISALTPLAGGNLFISIVNGILSITSVIGKAIQVVDTFVKESKVFQVIATIFSGVINLLASGISSFVKVIDQTIISAALKSLNNAISSISIRANDASKAVDNITNKFTNNSKFVNTVDKFSKGLSKVVDVIISFWSSLGTAFSNNGFNGIIDLLNTLFAGGLALSIGKFIKSIGESAENLTGFGSSIKDILSGVKDVLKTYQEQLKAKTLKTIAEAIAILAISLVAISLIDSEKLAGAIAGIASLFTALITSMVLYGAIGGPVKGVIKTNAMLIAMSTSIMILALALKSIGDLNIKQIMTGVAGIASLSAIMVLTSKALMIGGKTVIKGAFQMVIFAEAIKILCSAVEKLSSMNPSELKKGLLGTAALLGAVSIFMIGAKFGKMSVLTATGLYILAGALVKISSVCESMAKMKIEDITKSVLAISGLVLALGIGLRAFSTKSAFSAAGLYVAIFAISKLTPVLESFSSLKWKEIGKSMTVLGGSIAILSAGLLAMNTGLAGATSLVVAATAINILVPALKKMGNMSLTEIGKSMLTLAGAFTVLGIAGVTLTPLIPTILTLSASFALLGVGVLALGTGLTAISVGLTALAASAAAGAGALTIYVTAIANLGPMLATKLAETIVAFARGIGNSAEALGESVSQIILAFSDMIIKSAGPIAKALIIPLVEGIKVLAEYAPQLTEYLLDLLIGICDGLAAKIPELTKSVAKVFKSLFSSIADMIGGMNSQDLVNVILSMGMFAGILAAASFLSSLIPGALIGLAGMGLAVAEIGLIIAALGLLAKIPGVTWLMESGADFLSHIGSAIGAFIGGLVGSALDTATQHLPNMGKDLSAFIESLRPFIDGAKNIDPASISGLSLLAGAILTITKAEILDGLTSWLTGGSSMVKFGQDLAAFAPYFKIYSDSISGIDSSVVTASANAANTLALMSQNIPNNGGLLAWITGDNDIAAFGAKLKIFGIAFREYASSVAGVDANVVNNTSNAASTIVAMSKDIPNSGGLLSWIMGDNDLSTFGINLISFGVNFARYSKSISTVDSNVVESTSKAIDTLVNLQNKLPDSGGIFSNSDTLSSFGSELRVLGEHFAIFYSRVSGIDNTLVSNTIENIAKIAQLAKKITTDDSEGLSSFTDALKKLGDTGIDGFIKAFSNSNDKVSSSINTFILSTIASIKSKAGEFKITGLLLMQSMSEGLRSGDYIIKPNITKLLTDSLSAIKNARSLFYNASKMLSDGLKTGFDTRSLASRVVLTLTIAASEIRGKYNSFIQGGKYLIDGFILGMESKQSVVKSKATAIAKTALVAMRKELDIHSPSKKAYEIGKNVDVGLAEGIEDNQDVVEKASVKLGEAVVDNVEGTIKDKLEKMPYHEYIKYVAHRTNEVMAEVITGLKQSLVDEDTETQKRNEAKELADYKTNLKAKQDELDKFEASLKKEKKNKKKKKQTQENLKKENEQIVEKRKHLLDEIQKIQDDWDNRQLQKARSNTRNILQNYIDAIQEVKDEYHNKLQEIDNDVSSMSEKLSRYGELVKTLKDDETGKDIFKLEDLNKQVEQIDNYGKSLENLRERLEKIGMGDSHILDEVLSMGVDEGLRYMQLLEKKSEIGFEEYAKTYQKKQDLAQEIAERYYDRYYKVAKETYGKKIPEILGKMVDDSIKIGEDSIKGLKGGMESTLPELLKAARNIAKETLLAMQDELDIHSPSKKYAKLVGLPSIQGIGVGFVSGAKALKDKMVGAMKSPLEALRNTLLSLSDETYSDVNLEPVIRPVLDLSDIQNGTAKINSIFSRKHAISANSEITKAELPDDEPNKPDSNGGNSYQFVQNNYSPKALSRLDIYRQTKNQFSAMKGLV